MSIVYAMEIFFIYKACLGNGIPKLSLVLDKDTFLKVSLGFKLTFI